MTHSPPTTASVLLGAADELDALPYTRVGAIDLLRILREIAPTWALATSALSALAEHHQAVGEVPWTRRWSVLVYRVDAAKQMRAAAKSAEQAGLVTA